MLISSVQALEILDARGIPTILCILGLDDGSTHTASAPSGTSKSIFEIADWRDNDAQRFGGNGVKEAVQWIESEVASWLVGTVPHFAATDVMLSHALEKCTRGVGANSMLAVSIALSRAQAHTEKISLHQLLLRRSGYALQGKMPRCVFNVINGGMHAQNGLVIQELHIIPMQAGDIMESLEIATTVYKTLEIVVQRCNMIPAVGLEGGFALDMRFYGENAEAYALTLIENAISESGYSREDIALGIDVASSVIYDNNAQAYQWHGKKYSSGEFIQLLGELIERFNIAFIEDGAAATDEYGWQMLMKQFGDTRLIVSDDATATHHQLITRAASRGQCNAVVLKPNQVGTVSGALQARIVCSNYGMVSVASHRSGDTSDPFIADFSFATACDFLKAGAPARGERIAKYNRLLALAHSAPSACFL